VAAVAYVTTPGTEITVPQVADPWPWWNQAYATSTSTTTIMNALPGPWQAWNVQYSTSSLPYLNTTATTILLPQWGSWNAQYEETAELKAAWEAGRAEREAVAREREAAWEAGRAEREAVAREREAAYQRRQAVRAAASSRAAELLLSLLSEQQARSYTEHGWFEVRGSKGGRWRIRNQGQAGNVDLMPEIGNERDATFCCHPPGNLPAADAHLAQMLHLVTDEDGFRRIANVAYRRPGLRAVA
jgi:hypothetical protein